MDRISELPDGLILKILAPLSFKDVVRMSIMSRRWRYLWTLVPKLKVGEDFTLGMWERVCRSLAENNPQLLQRLELEFNGMYHVSTPINLWIEPVVNHGLKELSIELIYTSMTMPDRLYSCGSLETLILRRLSLKDVRPVVYFRSLKKLHLLSVRFPRDVSVEKLLGICPVLEELVVRRSTYVSVKIYTINVPTLRSLFIDYTWAISQPVGVHGFVIKAPSLTYLNIKDKFSNSLRFDHMPKLETAIVDVVCDQSESILRSLTSVQHLSLCFKTSKLQIPYHRGTFFSRLEDLELCTCSAGWWNLLTRMLEYAPRLRVLKLKNKAKHCVQYNDQMDCWIQPGSFTACVEILEWRQYNGTIREEEVATYILANASHLKMATFFSVSTEKPQMFKNLESVPISSQVCQLVFN